MLSRGEHEIFITSGQTSTKVAYWLPGVPGLNCWQIHCSVLFQFVINTVKGKTYLKAVCMHIIFLCSGRKNNLLVISLNPKLIPVY